MSGQTPAARDGGRTAESADLAKVFERIESRERHARRNAVIYATLPFVLAASLVAFTGYWVRKSAREVESLRTEKLRLDSDLRQLRDQNWKLEEQKRELETRLLEATELVKYERPINLEDIKSVASRNLKAGQILERVFGLRQGGVRWHLGGRSPQVGFDSPSFAVFILSELRLTGTELPRTGDDPGTWLREKLPETAELRSGDLVLYNSGYAMFYFEIPGREPFVIGMTPFGITALKPDFARRFGVRRIAG
jgi:hypothetical protein